MSKLLKYNFRESSRVLGPCLAIIFILNIFAYDVFEKMQSGWIISLLVFTNLIAFGIIVFHLGNSFMKEFNEDRRFLTFTLPIDGKRLILAKLFNTTIWLVFLGLVHFITAIILAVRTDSLRFSDFNFDMFGIHIKTIVSILVFVFFITLVGYMYFMFSGYLVEILSKIIYRGKSRLIQGIIAGSLWIGQFILFGNIAFRISEDMPLYYNAITGKLSLVKDAVRESLQISGAQAIGLDSINITAVIILGLISIGYFFGMAYLIDNKVDL